MIEFIWVQKYYYPLYYYLLGINKYQNLNSKKKYPRLGYEEMKTDLKNQDSFFESLGGQLLTIK